MEAYSATHNPRGEVMEDLEIEIDISDPFRIQKALALLESVERLEAWRKIKTTHYRSYVIYSAEGDARSIGSAYDGVKLIAEVNSNDPHDALIQLASTLGGK